MSRVDAILGMTDLTLTSLSETKLQIEARNDDGKDLKTVPKSWTSILVTEEDFIFCDVASHELTR